MKRNLSILMLALIMVLPATSQAYLGITGWFTNNFEFQCNEYERTALLEAAAVRFSMGGNVSLRLVQVATNTPPTWEDLQVDLFQTKDLLLDSHGAMELGGVASLLLEPYLDDASALDAYLQYQTDHGSSNFCYGGHTVGLTFQGISTLLAPWAENDGIKLIYACYSSFGRDAWGSFDSYNSGGSYFGYPIAIDNDIACNDLDIMVRVLSCEDYDFSGLENDILSSYKQSSGQGILFGNEENAFNPEVSCKSWDVNFGAVGAWDGAVHWISSNEQRWSQYIVEGVDTIGDRPDTLAIVNGYGFDGTGVYRSHSVAVPQRRYLRVREFDNLFVLTTSEWASWGEKPEDWMLEPGLELAMRPLRVMADGKIVGKGRLPAEKNLVIEPADVVVYTTEDISAEANRIRGSWQMTADMEGNFLRAKTWTGSVEPEAVQELYSLVWQANQDFNADNPDRPYRNRPILQIVGNGNRRIAEEDTIQVGPRYFTWAEDENGGSGNGIWKSYSLMTDVSGDGIPDGPVVVVPLLEYSEAQIHANAVEAWNMTGPANNDVLLCLDDQQGGVPAAWIDPRLFQDFETNYVTQRGLRLKDIYKESDYLPIDDWEATKAQMTAEGTAAINSGIAEVWYTGLAAGISNHTYFLEGVDQWNQQQGFLLFGPTCQFGDTELGPWSPQIRKEMFNPTGGIVVGGIGQLSAGYYHTHRKLALLMQEILPQMPEGTFLADAAFEIQQEFLSRYPEFRDYGLGIHCVGSVAKMLSSSVSGIPGDELALLQKFNLRGFITGSGGNVKFNLPRSGRVSLKVYDLKGRLVSILIEETMAQGEHSTGFSVNRMASGVYFARLQVGVESESVKFTLVK